MKNASRFIRKPTLLEQLYLDASYMGYNITPRAYIKIDQAPSRPMVAQALERLSQHMPLLNMRYRRTYWYRSEIAIPLHWLESDRDDIMQVSVPAVDWRTHTLSLSVIHLQPKNEWYLCFSMFHGMGDGYTLTHLLYAFFAAMDQRLTAKYDFSLTEHDFPEQTLKSTYPLAMTPRCQPACIGTQEGPFRLIRTESAPFMPTAMLCSAIPSLMKDRKSVMVIPVNMRRYCKPGEQIRMGNLMAPMFLDSAGKSAAQLRSDIHKNVTEAYLPILPRFLATLYRTVPGVLRRLILRCDVLLMRCLRRTPMAAMVSNVGKVQPEALRCAAFRGEDCWYFFENIPLFAITLLTVSFGDHSNTGITTHYSNISEASVQSIAGSIASIDVYATLE